MPNIITAINNEKILKKIIKNKITENKNILYKEAIIDILKKYKNIDAIIISEKIPGEINLIKLIEKINKINKKIKVIIILENKKIEKNLMKLKMIDIYYNNIFSIYKLIKNLKEKKYFINNQNINREKKINIIKLKNMINCKNKNLIKNKNKMIFIFGENKIDKDIIKLIILKKLIIKNKNIIIINLKINIKKEKNNKTINRKIIKINKTEKIYKLNLKIKIKIKEKRINNKIKEIVNINNILKNKNNLIKKRILKKLIRKYNKNNDYIIFNIQGFYKNINKIPIQSKYINIITLENNKKNLLKLNKLKKENINTYLILNNYIKNNLSKYIYKILLKNKFKKIKIINLN